MNQNKSVVISYTFGGAAQFWWLLLVLGTAAFILPHFYEVDVSLARVYGLGSSFVLTGLVFRTSHQQLQVDTSRKQIRLKNSFLGMGSGEWKSVKEIHEIILTEKNVTSWNTPNGISPTFKTDEVIYTLGIFFNQEQPEFIVQSTRQNKLENFRQLLESLR